MVITKESMNPEFLIDGIAYTAERNYSYMSHVPVVVVSCHRMDRELKGDGVKGSRKNIQWFIHSWGGFIAIIFLYAILMIPIFMEDGFSWEALVGLLSILIVYGTMAYRQKILHFNDKTK